MVPPGGGPKDSLAPVLVSAIPATKATQVQSKKIVLTFDEFITLEKIQENLIVTPVPKNNPIVEGRLRNITILLKDSLLPNTTYAFQFGNAIKDVNEGNIATGFSYVFSTGNSIDTLELDGTVLLAESGKTDSTLLAVLHKNLDDSAIKKLTPPYITRVDGKGKFSFKYLPSGLYKLYVVPNDFTKKYDDSTKRFAFLDQPIIINGVAENSPVLYAFEAFTKTSPPQRAPGRKKDEALKALPILENGAQNILLPLRFRFNDKVIQVNENLWKLTDSTGASKKIESFLFDTIRQELSIQHNWNAGNKYQIVIEKNAFTDSLGKTIPKNDTLKFRTLDEKEYGLLRLKFSNLDTSQHPVLLFYQENQLVESIALKERTFVKNRILPGSYELKILFDNNKNLKWDTGNFELKTQPEIVLPIEGKITIRANWDNEFDKTIPNRPGISK